MSPFKLLIDNKDEDFTPPTADWKVGTSLGIKDETYLKFIPVMNGGYYFSRALHIYGLCAEPASHSISYINELFNKEYESIIGPHLFFACDLFGNQFSFSDKGISFWNIETAESEIVAADFKEWIQVLEFELDYFTAEPLALEWQDGDTPLGFDERLTPKELFVLGGEYGLDNLKAEPLDKIIHFNSVIAKQIVDLPDGTPIDTDSIYVPDDL
jgi:hypothetical protein